MSHNHKTILRELIMLEKMGSKFFSQHSGGTKIEEKIFFTMQI
jgi:hypothetical protein